MGRIVVSKVRESSNKLSIPDFEDDASGPTVSRALPPDFTAVREARRVVQRVLSNWRADDIFDDVVLVASELVANALRHGLQVDEPMTRLGEREGVRISLVSTGSHVICAVTDPSDVPPVRQSADWFDGSGRGLQLVESLSLCWGWTLLDGDPEVRAVQGKSVWAIFPLAIGSPARAVGAA